MPAPKRVDSTKWKQQQPMVKSTAAMADWAKQNPNRLANARQSLREFQDNPTTATRARTPERDEMVAKWQAARPVSGKGGATSDAEKQHKQDQMIEWAQWNPNKGTNARRTIEKAKPARAKKAPVKKATPMKKGKKK